MSINHGTERAIASLGGREAAAERLGVTRQAIDKWINKRVPAERVLQLSVASGVPCREIRPDIYPPGLVA